MHRILIVEDDELIAELERDYLEASGFEVVLELNGTKGLEEVMRGGYDALILDVMLPGKSGFDICREVRQVLDLPVIMATVTVHVNRLREKVEKDPSNPQFIETVWGAGYRFKV